MARPFGIAVVILLVPASVIYTALTLLHVPTLAGFEFAQVPFLALHPVYEMLKGNQIKPSLAAPFGRPSQVDGFDLSWYVMLAYGSVMLAVIQQTSGGIGGFFVTLAGGTIDSLFVVAAVVYSVGAYLVGSWIGTRVASRPIVTVVGVAFLGSALAIALTYVFLSNETFEAYFSQAKDVAFFATSTATSGTICSMFGLLGLWRGRHVRSSRYVAYMLNTLPLDTRTALVDLIGEEARARSTG